jgi:hypothetical protein
MRKGKAVSIGKLKLSNLHKSLKKIKTLVSMIKIVNFLFLVLAHELLLFMRTEKAVSIGNLNHKSLKKFKTLVAMMMVRFHLGLRGNGQRRPIVLWN